MRSTAFWLVSGLWVLASATPALATPEYARRYDTTCRTCHSLPPKLNAVGVAFAAAGYRLPDADAEARRAPKLASIPFATWVTTRWEDIRPADTSDTYLPKVELISGGTIGERLSYFVEWRIVSLSLNNDGSLRDRGGRFEDLFLDWGVTENQTLRFGQFRSLNQIDVSLRLSTSEPLLVNNGLRVDTSPNPRVHGLGTFSPSARSPSVGWIFRSIRGDGPGDGLFHYVTVPFVGELSIPLGREASETASFELGSAKGVYAETFYRKKLNSAGVHAFVEDDAWLATALGTWNPLRGLYLEGGFGIDDRAGPEGSRRRGSVQAEYVHEPAGNGPWRAGAGVRVEEVSGDGRSRALIPYLVAAAPIRQYTFVLQVEYRDQEGNDRLTVDLSALF